MGTFRKSALAIGTAAILATSGAPAMAAATLDRDKSVLKTAGEYDGWSRRHRYRHRDRVDGGDIFAGIAILAGIAIVADAASKAERTRNAERYPVDHYPPIEPTDIRNGHRDNDVGSAVDACSSAAEQGGGRVEEIRSVTRDGEGWRVEGDLSGSDDNGTFTCGASGGEVDFIQLGNND